MGYEYEDASILDGLQEYPIESLTRRSSQGVPLWVCVSSVIDDPVRGAVSWKTTGSDPRSCVEAMLSKLGAPKNRQRPDEHTLAVFRKIEAESCRKIQELSQA